MHAFLIRHNIADKKIAVAVSGGADSLALVLMAKEQLTVLGYTIIALTVDHGLRPSSLQEAEYVAEIMRQNNIEHHILTWKGAKPQQGIEEAARKARYKLLIEWCKLHQINVLMTAHHAYDQAETFLMRLQRGSGLSGLCCMREAVQKDGIYVIRPLLNTKPEALKLYLKQKNIEWIEDESNQDNKYLRNLMRHYLPEFSIKTGISVDKIITAVNNLQCAEDFLQCQILQIKKAQIKILAKDVCFFNYSDFLSWHSQVQYQIMADFCRRYYTPRAESVNKIVSSLKKLPFNGATLGDKEIFMYDKKVWIVPEVSSKHRSSNKEWKDFIMKHNEFIGMKIPHKARLAILMTEEII